MKKESVLEKMARVWESSFSDDSLEKFLKRVRSSISSYDIRDEAMMQLHKLTQLEELRKKGVINNDEYSQKQNEISTAFKGTLLKIMNEYLPILPLKAVAGYESGPQYAVQKQQIEEWKHIENGEIRDKIGIRVEGDSMHPGYSDGDNLICSKSNLKSITERQAVVVVGVDNSVFLKRVKRLGNEIELNSINPDYKPFKMALEEVFEIWVVEDKVL